MRNHSDLRKFILKYRMNYVINSLKCRHIQNITIDTTNQNIIGEHMFDYCE